MSLLIVCFARLALASLRCEGGGAPIDGVVLPMEQAGLLSTGVEVKVSQFKVCDGQDCYVISIRRPRFSIASRGVATDIDLPR